MFGLHNCRVLFVFLLLLIVSGCSKNAQIESVLENYYRAAAKGDTSRLVEQTDYSMFTPTNTWDVLGMQYYTHQIVSEMNELSNANGELQKIKVTETKELKEKEGDFLVVTHDLIFKSGRTITRKNVLSRQGGKFKVLIVKEW